MIPARLFPYVVWLVIGTVWGTTWGVIRVGLRDLPPFTFAALRTVLAGTVLLLAAALMHGGRRPSGRELWFWIAMGAPQMGIPYALIFWAEQTISSSLTAVLFATFPAFTAVIAHFVLRDEPLSAAKVVGTLLAVVAVILLIGPASAAVGTDLWAMAAILTATISAALGAVLVRRYGRRTSTLWLTALQIASGGVLLTGVALLLERGRTVAMTPTAVLSVLYLALVVTVGCYLGLFWLLKRLDATFVSMGVIFEIAIAVLLGVVLLDEPVGLPMLVGAVLVVVSIVMVTRGGGVRSPRSAAETAVP